jgi:hypothetical protein
MRVELRYATLPPPLGAIAVHHWFVVRDRDRCERWEVWQARNAGGRSIGYVHCNLKPPDAGVGGGPARLARTWNGAHAAAIARVLENARDYPYVERYVAWPGPNSNTFVAWVLREARIDAKLGWMALGKRYPVGRRKLRRER